MGRPLNKKYFGNRNTGSASTTSDNYGIGGEGIASFNITNGGNYINRLPTLTAFTAPSLPTGVTFAGVLHSHAQNASPNAKGTGYQIGDILIGIMDELMSRRDLNETGTDYTKEPNLQ